MRMYFIAIGLCLWLTGCVQPLIEREVTFTVDMRNQANVQSVEIKGEAPFLSWDEGVELKDSDGDGIFQTTVKSKAAYTYFEFKTVMNGNVYELDGTGNRTVTFADEGSTSVSIVFDNP